MIDYKAEQTRLESFKPEDASLYWKPKAGQHKVKALSELEEAEPFDDRPQAKLKIVIDGEEKDWTFSVGKTPASTYGQIVELAMKKGGNIKDVEFTVVVVFDGNKNSYTIVD